MPKLRRALILIDPKDPATPRFLTETRATAKGYNLRLIERSVTTEADVKRVFAGLKESDVDGIIALSPNLKKCKVSILNVVG